MPRYRRRIGPRFRGRRRYRGSRRPVSGLRRFASAAIVILIIAAGVAAFLMLRDNSSSPETVDLSTPAATSSPNLFITPGSTSTLASPIPTLDPNPQLRHLEKKAYMLELINEERVRAGLDHVAMAENVAAQLHAESSLEDCTSSHWGGDGLKPNMRYSLAGGYQANGENGHGLDYCITSADGYQAIANIKHEIDEAMNGWMQSAGHRDNILDPWHRKVNIGLAWDNYNFVAFQHFEGDYIEYERLPTLTGNNLTFVARVKNGVTLSDEWDLAVQIYYDPPRKHLPMASWRGLIATIQALRLRPSGPQLAEGVIRNIPTSQLMILAPIPMMSLRERPRLAH